VASEYEARSAPGFVFADHLLRRIPQEPRPKRLSSDPNTSRRRNVGAIEHLDDCAVGTQTQP
jgi:hypothetical protein